MKKFTWERVGLLSALLLFIVCVASAADGEYGYGEAGERGAVPPRTEIRADPARRARPVRNQNTVQIIGMEEPVREPRRISAEDIKLLFREISSIVVVKAGENVILDGTVGTPMAKSRVDMVVESFDNVIDLTVQKDNLEINAIIAQEIKERINNEGINVSLLRGSIILSGKAANESDMQKAINIASTYYDRVVNNIEVDEQMVEIDLAFVSIARGKDKDIGGNPLSAVSGAVGYAGNLNDVWRSRGQDYSLTLNTEWIWQFIAEDRNNQVLNRPHLTTVTRKGATFHQGGERGYNVVTQDTSNVDFKEYGIMVSVMPELTGDGKIRCDVSFEVTLPEANATRLDFTTYKTSATALLESGQSLVLSGLLRDIQERIRSGLPVLRNIPILNFFASRNRDSRVQDDLVLIVTPSMPTKCVAPSTSYSLEQMKTVPMEDLRVRLDDFGTRNLHKNARNKRRRRP